METLIIHPENVCSREIVIEHENGVILNATFTGGCQGNLTGICNLIKGMKVSDVVNKLTGIKCRGSRNGNTSCPDQIANGLKSIL